MSGVFDTSDLSTTAGSAVAPTQGASSNDVTLIEGVGALAKGALSKYNDYKASEAELASNTAVQGIAGQFAALNHAVSGSKMSASVANAQKKQLIVQAASQGVDMTKLSKLMGIGMGDEEVFESPKAKADKENLELANEAGKINSSWTPEKQAAMAENYRIQRASLVDLENAQKRLTYNKGEDEYNKSIAKQESTKALLGYIKTVTVDNEATTETILGDYQKSTKTPEDLKTANQRLEELKQKVQEGLGGFAGAERDTLERLGGTVTGQLDLATRVLNGTLTEEAYKRQTANIMAFEDHRFMSDPNSALISSISRNVKTLALTSFMSDNVLKHLRQNLDKGGYKPADILITKQEASDDPAAKDGVGEYMNAVSEIGTEALKDKAASPELIQQHKDFLDKQYLGIYQGITKGTDGDVTQYKQVVEFLADPKNFEVMEWLGSGSAPPEARKNAADALGNYGSEMMSTIKSHLEAKTLGTTAGGAWMATDRSLESKTIIELAKPTFRASTGGVYMELVPRQGVNLNPVQRAKISSLTQQVNKQVMTAIRAVAHAEGHKNYKAVFEDRYAELFGEDLNDKAE